MRDRLIKNTGSSLKSAVKSANPIKISLAQLLYHFRGEVLTISRLVHPRLNRNLMYLIVRCVAVVVKDSILIPLVEKTGIIKIKIWLTREINRDKSH